MPCIPHQCRETLVLKSPAATCMGEDVHGNKYFEDSAQPAGRLPILCVHVVAAYLPARLLHTATHRCRCCQKHSDASTLPLACRPAPVGAVRRQAQADWLGPNHGAARVARCAPTAARTTLPASQPRGQATAVLLRCRPCRCAGNPSSAMLHAFAVWRCRVAALHDRQQARRQAGELPHLLGGAPRPPQPDWLLQALPAKGAHDRNTEHASVHPVFCLAAATGKPPWLC